MRPGPAQSVIRDGRPASSPVPECSSAHLYSCSPKLSVTRWPLVQWQDTGLWIREWWFEPTGANCTYGSRRRDGPVGAPFRAPLGEPREPARLTARTWGGSCPSASGSKCSCPSSRSRAAGADRGDSQFTLGLDPPPPEQGHELAERHRFGRVLAQPRAGNEAVGELERLPLRVLDGLGDEPAARVADGETAVAPK